MAERTYWIPTAGAAGVEVTMPYPSSDSRWICRGCDEKASLYGTSQTAMDLLAAAGTHAAMCGRGTVAAKMESEVAAARAELVRVDGKAATLLALAGAALTIGLAVLGRAGLPVAAAAAGWLAVALLGAGVVLLAMAIKPNLTGDHGIMRYAAATGPDELLADFAATQVSRTPLFDLADTLAWNARAARRKYTRVGHAVTLMLAGLAAIAVTAVLASLLG